MTTHEDSPDRALDELLRLDPEPEFQPEAMARLQTRLAEARIDAALEADEVETPAGLPHRVLSRVRGAAHGRPRRSRRFLGLVPLAAAAAVLAIWTWRGGEPGEEPARGADVAMVAEYVEPVSDELLASLSLLENMEFLTEELDPLEADALFLLDVEEQILLDLLDAELDDVGEDD